MFYQGTLSYPGIPLEPYNLRARAGETSLISIMQNVRCRLKNDTLSLHGAPVGVRVPITISREAKRMGTTTRSLRWLRSTNNTRYS